MVKYASKIKQDKRLYLTQVINELLHGIQVFPRRRRECQNPEVLRPLHQLLHDDDVRVVPGCSMSFVDDQALDVPMLQITAVQIVRHHLRRQIENPLISPSEEGGGMQDGAITTVRLVTREIEASVYECACVRVCV